MMHRLITLSDNENSLAPEGASEDASDSDSTSLEDFNVETGRKLVTSPYDDIIVETSKLPTKLSDYVLDDKVNHDAEFSLDLSRLTTTLNRLERSIQTGINKWYQSLLRNSE
ncbi:hypothetical protein Tco_0679042 [Tanacetum coccineum]|uniref:Uncharacterized protein n=1 Tax=Tanacetum coccineum TaxID=301880 RepID=A0ABQ4XHQ8_9ASTR